MKHRYQAVLEWNNLNNDLNVRTYSRNHTVTFEHKPTLQVSADPNFRGDKTLYNPEEMLLAAVASCHMLSYLYRCALNGIVVTSYSDKAVGEMYYDGEAGGRFTGITLHPVVIITDKTKIHLAKELHHLANKDCFIANSLNFNVKHLPTIE